LNYKSISVGQHIIARGIYSLSSANVHHARRHGHIQHEHGSVRILPTQLWGSLVSSMAGTCC